MFGRKKKEAKVEKVFESADSNDKITEELNEDGKIDDEILGVNNTEENKEEKELTKSQKEKLEKLDSVKSKISKILKASNIEIVDENVGDEYEFDGNSDAEKQQQDYDALKALFGGADKSKKQELTLTIDDYDYTYTGQYVDEFDFVHMKNIKKVKLQNKHKKLIKRLSIAAAAVVVIGVGVTLGIVLTRKTPVYLKSVSLSQTEQSYYLDSPFDYRGLKILAEYSNGTVETIQLNGSYFYDSVGYVERINGDLVFTDGEQATLYFVYSGQQASIKINILRKNLTGITEKHKAALFNLKAGDYLTNEVLQIKATYSNYRDELINFADVSITVAGTPLLYDKEHKGFAVTTDFENYGSGTYISISYRGYSSRIYFE